MTFSIVALCPETGHRGIAVASRFFRRRRDRALYPRRSRCGG